MTSDWLGGGLIFALAAVLWLIYLIPTWFRRNEFLSTERNVVRLQQTLRILAETSEVPDEIHAEANARSVAEQQRLLKKANAQNLLAERAGLQSLIEQGLAAQAAAESERELRERALQQARALETPDGGFSNDDVDPSDSGDYETIVLAPTPTAPTFRQASLKLRRARAATSGILLLSLVVTVLGAVQTAVNGAWIVLVIGAVAATLCVTRLSRLARDARALRARGLPVGAGAGVSAASSSTGASSSSRGARRASGVRPGYRSSTHTSLADVDDLFGDAAVADVEGVSPDGALSPDGEQARPIHDPGAGDSGWTPVPLPKPLYVGHRRIEGGTPVALYIEQTAERAEEALRAAARESELALRAAQAATPTHSAALAHTAGLAPTEAIGAESNDAVAALGSRPASPSRFAAMGVVDQNETGAIDVDRVLARRRAG